MNHNRFRLLFISALITLLVSACGMLAATPAAPSDPQAVYTAAAQTVIAQVTLSAGETAVAQLTRMASDATQPAEPTATLPATIPTTAPGEPTATPLPTATATPLPTATAVPPTATQVAPTPTPLPCNLAQFVKDVTIPDGTTFNPGDRFSKTWRIRNIGTCTWTPNYTLVFVNGASMDAQNVNYLPGTVRPGEYIDLTVDMRAPATPGRYKGSWMLRSPAGEVFGLGDYGDVAFWADIKVSVVAPAPNKKYAYDFAANYCSATWYNSSDAYALDCPGNGSEDQGSVVLLTAPDLENDRQENELTLWTRPDQIRGGSISGVFPKYKIQDGDHFLADVGCLQDSRGCDVIFSIDYRTGNATHSLGEWREIYDGSLTRIDIDLSFLAGRSVQFILTVTNNGKPTQANAFWLVPSVQRLGNTNPPTGVDPAAQKAVAAAVKTVADTLGLKNNQVQVLNVEGPIQWADTCLEVRLRSHVQVCAQAIITGYRVNMLADGTKVEAHTNQDGSVVYFIVKTR